MSLSSVIGGIYSWISGQPSQPPWCTPSYADVCTARAHLKALDLPTEIILQILDYAEYWPKYEYEHRRTTAANARHGRGTVAALCFSQSPYDNPLVEEIRANGETPKVKSIEFNIESADQGWTTENTRGTFHTSSWVEVSILRRMNRDAAQTSGYENDTLCSPLNYHNILSSEGLVKRPASAHQGPQGGEGDFAWYLQGNRVVAGFQSYRVLWTADDWETDEGNEGAGSGEGFISELRDGDKVVVWARAKVRATAGLDCIWEVDSSRTVYWLAVYRQRRRSYSALWFLRDYFACDGGTRDWSGAGEQSLPRDDVKAGHLFSQRRRVVFNFPARQRARWLRDDCDDWCG